MTNFRRTIFSLLGVLFLVCLLTAAVGPGTGPESVFTQTLKTNTTAAAWRSALGVVGSNNMNSSQFTLSSGTNSVKSGAPFTNSNLRGITTVSNILPSAADTVSLGTNGNPFSQIFVGQAGVAFHNSTLDKTIRLIAPATITDAGYSLTMPEAFAAGALTADEDGHLSFNPNYLTNVTDNLTNLVSLSASNATSKPILRNISTNTGIFFGLQAGAGVTVTPNASNIVIAATSPVSVSTNGASVATAATNINFIGSTNTSLLATNDNGNVTIQVLAETIPQMLVFTNASAQENWTNSVGAHKLRVRCWGGGGAGGFTTGLICSGGGGGGYAEGFFSVAANDVITISVGGGGTSPSAGTGRDGTNTFVTNTTSGAWVVSATGGGGGTSGASGGIGGAPGEGNGGLINLVGESGEGSTADKSGGGGHGALGGAPGRSNISSSGQSGRAPGGGGAGSAAGSAAGEGGHGMVILEFLTR